MKFIKKHWIDFALIVAFSLFTVYSYISGFTPGIEIAKGNFNQRIKIKTQDEIGELGTTFNQMTTELKDSREKLCLK